MTDLDVATQEHLFLQSSRTLTLALLKLEVDVRLPDLFRVQERLSQCAEFDYGSSSSARAALNWAKAEMFVGSYLMYFS